MVLKRKVPCRRMYVQAHDDGKERVQIVILLAANLNKNKEGERERDEFITNSFFCAEKRSRQRLQHKKREQIKNFLIKTNE